MTVSIVLLFLLLLACSIIGLISVFKFLALAALTVITLIGTWLEDGFVAGFLVSLIPGAAALVAAAITALSAWGFIWSLGELLAA